MKRVITIDDIRLYTAEDVEMLEVNCHEIVDMLLARYDVARSALERISKYGELNGQLQLESYFHRKCVLDARETLAKLDGDE